MTKDLVSNERRLSTSAITAMLITVGAVLSWFCFSTEAQEQTGAPESVEMLAAAETPEGLERAFWLCDYVATTRSVDTGTAIACSTVTEELKVKNFNGDFDAMLAWWRKNKPAEHQALEAASRAKADMETAALTTR